MDAEITSTFSLFFDDIPIVIRKIDTGHGDNDFRETVIIETDLGNKYVMKLADNDFTFPEKIGVWKRTVKEYQKLGYYCPRIYHDKSGIFPVIDFCGHKCVVYAEEYAPFHPASNRDSDDKSQNKTLYESYKQDVWKMTARVAAQYFDYTEHPSAYCLFESFCPSDKTDEVLENALAWKDYADTLPLEFKEQVERIWRLWTDNRTALEPIYKQLPTSIFQADLNPTNILLDDKNRFVGVYDFNLCGRDVFLNYLMRENFSDFQNELTMICDALRIAKDYYQFSDLEKDTALILYRCLKPLSFIGLESLKELGNDSKAIRAFLDETEYYLTAQIDFRKYME